MIQRFNTATELPERQRAIKARCFHPAGTFVEFKKEEIEQSIPDRFEQQVRGYPDRFAVKTESQQPTYDEPNRAANRVAQAILAQRGEGGGEGIPISPEDEQGRLHRPGRRSSDNLWAITCYFNPIDFKRRLENYHTFWRHLAVPLVTVELSFNGSFQLRHGDADILVQLHGGDVLWQKERLLNVALQSVPDTCDTIAWLDCDVVFESDDWAERASRALDHFSLLHLFHERHDLPRHARLDQLRTWDAPPTSQSVAYKMAAGEAAPEDLFLAGAPLDRRSTAGLAWASRRSVLEEHGLYDACILGSGDRAILCAALGKFDYAAQALRMNARRFEHYLAWARPYSDAMRGRVGYIQDRIFHLWHGDLSDRQYAERQRRLEEFDFDPFADIAIDRNGCWRWNSGKSDLHGYAKRYFASRNEDGVPGSNDSQEVMDGHGSDE